AFVIHDGRDLGGAEIIHSADGRHGGIAFADAAVVAVEDDAEMLFGVGVVDDGAAFKRWEGAFESFAILLVTSLAVGGVEGAAMGGGGGAAVVVARVDGFGI